MARFVFLNALPLNALPQAQLELSVVPVDIDKLRERLKLAQRRGIKIVSYIRHPATVELINKLLNLDLKPSSELYKYETGDLMFVVTLKKPIRGAEIEKVSKEDVTIYEVDVIDIFW